MSYASNVCEDTSPCLGSTACVGSTVITIGKEVLCDRKGEDLSTFQADRIDMKLLEKSFFG